MRKIPLLIACLAWAVVFHAQQNATDSSVIAKAIDYAKVKYDSQRARESAIYNGIQFYPYLHTIEGIPFFWSADWQTGTIVYDNVVYRDMYLKYDLVKDQVVITPDDKGGLFIALFGPRVSEFSFLEYKFLRLGKPGDGSLLPEGFYRILTRGKVSAFSKKIKWIFEQVADQTIYRRFDEKTKYYILKDGVYYNIRKGGELLDLLQGHKKEVQQYLAGKKLKFKRAPEETITAAVEYYNQLER
jgi:hypothetical protein